MSMVNQNPNSTVRLHIIENFLQAWLPIYSTHHLNLLCADYFPGSNEADGSAIRAISAFTEFFNFWSDPSKEMKILKTFNLWFIESDKSNFDILVINTKELLDKRLVDYCIRCNILKEEVNFNVQDHSYKLEKNGRSVILNIRYELNDYHNVNFHSYGKECTHKFILFDAEITTQLNNEFLPYDVLVTIKDKNTYKTENREKGEPVYAPILCDQTTKIIKEEKKTDSIKIEIEISNPPFLLNLTFNIKNYCYLKFLTNRPISFQRMKEAMFIYDQLVNNEPRFQFEFQLNSPDNNKIISVEKSLLKTKIYDYKLYHESSAKNLFDYFKNFSNNQISIEKIEEYVWYKTPYIFRKESIRCCARKNFMIYCMKKNENGTQSLLNLFDFRANTFNNVNIKFFDSEYDNEVVKRKILFQLKNWFPAEIEIKNFEKVIKHTAIYYILNLRDKTEFTKFKNYLKINNFAIFNKNKKIKLLI